MEANYHVAIFVLAPPPKYDGNARNAAPAADAHYQSQTTTVAFGGHARLTRDHGGG